MKPESPVAEQSVPLKLIAGALHGSVSQSKASLFTVNVLVQSVAFASVAVITMSVPIAAVTVFPVTVPPVTVKAAASVVSTFVVKLTLYMVASTQVG